MLTHAFGHADESEALLDAHAAMTPRSAAPLIAAYGSGESPLQKGASVHSRRESETPPVRPSTSMMREERARTGQWACAEVWAWACAHRAGGELRARDAFRPVRRAAPPPPGAMAAGIVPRNKTGLRSDI